MYLEKYLFWHVRNRKGKMSIGGYLGWLKENLRWGQNICSWSDRWGFKTSSHDLKNLQPLVFPHIFQGSKAPISQELKLLSGRNRDFYEKRISMVCEQDVLYTS